MVVVFGSRTALDGSSDTVFVKGLLRLQEFQSVVRWRIPFGVFGPSSPLEEDGQKAVEV
jgi:hypothetical protein